MVGTGPFVYFEHLEVLKQISKPTKKLYKDEREKITLSKKKKKVCLYIKNILIRNQ